MANFKTWTICHLSVFMTFIISGLLINCVQACLYISIGWWQPTLFRKLNYYLVWMIYAQLLFLADWWSDSEVRIYADPKLVSEVGQHSALIIMNHHFELDWMCGWMVADRFGVLGNARVFVKKMLKYVPIVGWAWNFSDVAFLERNWEKDQDIMTQSVQALSDYPDPVWLLIFAEGTRLSPEKLEASRDFARSRGLPILRHCLTPRTKGFSHVMENIDASKVPYIYDVTLAVHPKDGGPATIPNILVGRKFVGEVYIRRIDISQVPKDPKGSAQFLMELYESKDKLIDNFALTGQFEPGQKSQPLIPPRRIYSLLNTIIWNVLIVPTVFGQIGVFAFSGSMWQFALALLGVIVMYIALRKFIGLTKISKGSSYGNKKKD